MAVAAPTTAEPAAEPATVPLSPMRLPCLALFEEVGIMRLYRGFLLDFLLICLNSYGSFESSINFYDIQCNPCSSHQC